MPAKQEEHDNNELGNPYKSKNKKKVREEAVWHVTEVENERLFFNTEYIGNTPLAGRSSIEVEEEAIKWSKVGLIRVGDILREDGRAVLSKQRMALRYPHLDMNYYDYIIKESPAEWHNALRSRSRCAELEKELKEEYLIGIVETMQEKETEIRIEYIKAKDIYQRLIARRWSTPEAMRPGGVVESIWQQKQRPRSTYKKDISRVLREMRHPIIPTYMSDRIMKEGIGREFGGAKFYGQTVEQGKCNRCKEALTNSHKYQTCTEVHKAWTLALSAWERHTGEKLSASDPWITAWGARWANWESQEEEDKYGTVSMKERFKALHAAMIEAIHTEANKATPGNAKRIYNKAQAIHQK